MEILLQKYYTDLAHGSEGMMSAFNLSHQTGVMKIMMRTPRNDDFVQENIKSVFRNGNSYYNVTIEPMFSGSGSDEEGEFTITSLGHSRVIGNCHY